MAEEIKKRVNVKCSIVLFEDQIEKLDKISIEKGVSRAQLIKEGADIIIKQHGK